MAKAREIEREREREREDIIHAWTIIFESFLKDTNSDIENIDS